MTDVENLVRATLERRAGGPVDAASLVTQVRARRSRRRWSRVGGAAAGLLVLVGVAGIVTAVWRGAGSPSGGSGRAIFLPLADVPGAAAQPSTVGTDPNVVHFAAPGLEVAAVHYTWTSAEGYEQLEAGLDGGLVSVTIGQDPAALDAGERQNNVGVVVRREAAAGLWLRVQARDDALAERVLGMVDLNRSQRIILPLQLTTRPAGSVMREAYVGFVGDRYAHGGVILRRGDGATMEVQAQYARDGGLDNRSANHTVDGRPGFLYPGLDEVALLNIPNLDVTARIGKGYSGFTVADADLVLTGLVVGADVEQASTWPQHLTAP